MATFYIGRQLPHRVSHFSSQRLFPESPLVIYSERHKRTQFRSFSILWFSGQREMTVYPERFSVGNSNGGHKALNERHSAGDLRLCLIFSRVPITTQFSTYPKLQYFMHYNEFGFIHKKWVGLSYFTYRYFRNLASSNTSQTWCLHIKTGSSVLKCMYHFAHDEHAYTIATSAKISAITVMIVIVTII